MEKHPYSDYLGIEITYADEFRAEGNIKNRKELRDSLTHVTGGAYASLADAVGGACARATGDMYVTQGCSLQFYVSTEEKDSILYAKAFVRHRGTKTCIIAVELISESGITVCDSQFSYCKI